MKKQRTCCKCKKQSTAVLEYGIASTQSGMGAKEWICLPCLKEVSK